MLMRHYDLTEDEDRERLAVADGPAETSAPACPGCDSELGAADPADAELGCESCQAAHLSEMDELGARIGRQAAAMLAEQREREAQQYRPIPRPIADATAARLYAELVPQHDAHVTARNEA